MLVIAHRYDSSDTNIEQHYFVTDVQPACLTKLAVHTMRTIYNPPNLVLFGLDKKPLL